MQFSNDGSQVIAVITTPNANLASMLMTTFQGYGQQNQLFVERMATPNSLPTPTTALNVGVTSESDIFSSIFRYAAPIGGATNPSTPGAMWRANAANNVLVYRVQLPNPDTSAVATPTLDSQSCNTNETLLAGAPYYCLSNGAKFDADLQQIAMLIQNSSQLNVAGYTYQTAQFPYDAGQLTMGSSPKGPICIQNGTTCVGATQDNNAYRGKNIGQLIPSAPAFVIGVIHSTSTDVTSTAPVNNAAYTSVGAADGTDNAGVADITQANIAQTGVPPDALHLNGSASAVLTALGITITPAQYPQLSADLPNLYITVFARPTCNATYCQQGTFYVSTINSSNNVPPNIPFPDSVFLTERGYMLPSVGSSAPLTKTLTGAMAPYLESPYVVYAVPNSNALAQRRYGRSPH